MSVTVAATSKLVRFNKIIFNKILNTKLEIYEMYISLRLFSNLNFMALNCNNPKNKLLKMIGGKICE